MATRFKNDPWAKQRIRQRLDDGQGHSSNVIIRDPGFWDKTKDGIVKSWAVAKSLWWLASRVGPVVIFATSGAVAYAGIEHFVIRPDAAWDYIPPEVHLSYNDRAKACGKSHLGLFYNKTACDTWTTADPKGAEVAQAVPLPKPLGTGSSIAPPLLQAPPPPTMALPRFLLVKASPAGIPLVGDPPPLSLQQTPWPTGNEGGGSCVLNRSIGVPAAYRDTICRESRRYGLIPDLLAAQLKQESGFRANALSSAGCMGIAQVSRDSARRARLNPWDPHASIAYMARRVSDNIQHFRKQGHSRKDCYKLAWAEYNGSRKAAIHFKLLGLRFTFNPRARKSSWDYETARYVNSIAAIGHLDYFY